MTELCVTLELGATCTSSRMSSCLFPPTMIFITQENPTRQSGGLTFSLANKFTSETSADVQADDAPVQKRAGVDPASRPAGLTLRTPMNNDSAKKPAVVPTQGQEDGRAKEIRSPVRRAIDWIPAPLLCKRLNVPVPKASSTMDSAVKGRLQAGLAAAAAPREDVLGSMQKFVPDSSTSSRPQV